MGQVIVNMSVTLDGVIQAPGRADEDPRDGFQHGGWMLPYADQVMAEQAGKGMAQPVAMLFGRRTYEDFYSVWPAREGDGNPFSGFMNKHQKYVVSRTLDEPLPWVNSTLLKGEAAETVARLRKESDLDLVVLGSGELVRSLTRHGLVDRYALSIHPLVLGKGRRLFAADDTFAKLRLVESTTTTTGVIMAVYEPAGGTL
jgi:dihydrofolate reductase